MSTLSVTTINTANGTTDLTMKTGNATPVGIVISAANGNIGVNNATPTSTLFITGSLAKTSGTFNINHPDPLKNATHGLRHSFVESPTRGDNIYRYTINIDDTLTKNISLPDYWKYLNENPQVWVNSVNTFGKGYGIVDDNLSTLTVHVDVKGQYNILLIGTRKDKDAIEGFDLLGVEYLR